MIYLRAEFHRHMCDDALDIRVQPKSKGKRRTPDILLIYILKRNIFIKNGVRVPQLLMTGLRTRWYGSSKQSTFPAPPTRSDVTVT